MSALTTEPSRIEQFGERLAGIYNDAALTLMISIGHRTGLFDSMHRMPAGGTSQQIAEESGLNERYVREWLGAMTTGRIVEHDHTTGAYWLPEEHAAMLTRSAAPTNLSVVAQFIPVLASVESEVVAAFGHGQGVPYSAYDRFHEVMAEESGQTVVAALEEHILPVVPGLIERLESGIDVMDVGCGAGRAMIHLAELYPKSRFRGVDFSEEAVGMARDVVRERGLRNVTFDVVDAAAVDDEASYDLITTFDAIHDQVVPDRVLANIRRALRPDGVYLMQEIAGSSCVHCNIDAPMGPFTYTISCMHCMSVSLAGGGAGLGAAWGRELAQRMLGEAGFGEVEIHDLPHDAMNHYYVVRR